MNLTVAVTKMTIAGKNAALAAAAPLRVRCVVKAANPTTTIVVTTSALSTILATISSANISATRAHLINRLVQGQSRFALLRFQPLYHVAKPLLERHLKSPRLHQILRDPNIGAPTFWIIKRHRLKTHIQFFIRQNFANDIHKL